jgi:hypothetical protein
MNYRVVTDPQQLIQLGWKELVDSHPSGTVFQSPDMYELFDRTEKMKPVVIGAVEESGSQLAGILLGVTIREMKGLMGRFSARTVVYGGPLVDPGLGNPQEVSELLLSGLIRAVQDISVFIQFRNFRDMESEKPALEKFGFNFRERLNYLVDTSSEDLVRSKLGPEKARQVKKALKNGASISDANSEQEVFELFTILHDLYRHKVKKPLPDWSFFREFYRLSQEGRLGTIKLVKYRGKVIGGIVCPVTPGKTIYEWYVCGLDQENRDAYPSVLATWAAIDHALKHTIPCFDFMGVGIPGRNYGVRNFKSRFGGDMVNYGRFARINGKGLYFIAETGYNVLALFRKI